jgi:uncharacterized protein YuzE
MTNSRNCQGFELSINARRDGSLEAAYVQVSSAPVAYTKELIKSVLLLDLDEKGGLVGIEILAPVKISQVLELAETLDSSQRDSFLKFVHGSVPPSLVAS